MASVPNTLLIDGNDLRADFPGLSILGDMNLYAPGTRRGSDQVIPGGTGQVPVPGLPLDAYAFSVFVKIQGATRGEKEARLRTLATVLMGTNHDGLVTLTRRLANAADDGYDECTAQGRFVTGMAFALWNPYSGKTELQFINLTGGWRRSTDNVLTVP